MKRFRDPNLLIFSLRHPPQVEKKSGEGLGTPYGRFQTWYLLSQCIVVPEMEADRVVQHGTTMEAHSAPKMETQSWRLNMCFANLVKSTQIWATEK